YTTLAPDEMTADPVFSFNPDLPDVSNIHEATFVFDCEDASRGVLNLPDGRRFVVRDPSNWVERPRVGVPYSRRIEALFEEGAPLVQTDNATRISSSDAEGGGCASVGPNPGAASAWLFAMVLAGFTWRRRRA
ncbi:MAG: MYXO-CTERM sorting domain-containing protein, partial [Myxococcota bacterium]